MSLSALKGPAEVEAEILMSRTAFAGSFMVVEGDGDSRFFRKRIDDSVCEIVIAGGKPAVVGGIARLNNKDFHGALGIVDDDCDCVDGRPVPSTNLIPTRDVRDLDAMLVWSTAFDGLMAEYADPVRVKAFGGHSAIRAAVAQVAFPFGAIRRWSYVAKADIDFKSLPPYRFVTPDWKFKQTDLFDAAAQQINIAPADLIAQVQALPDADARLVCQGHDLIAVLAIGMSKGGILGSSGSSPDKIASALRLAFDARSWLTSTLSVDIRKWEVMNPPYRCLP